MLELNRGAVLRVLWGCLPAVTEGSRKLAVREVVVDHGRQGGPAGLFSVSGVKFTTARLVAERTLARISALGDRSATVEGDCLRPLPRPVPGASELEDLWREDPEGAAHQIRHIVQEEAVVRMDDLILRRTDWGLDPATGRRLAGLVAPLLNLDPAP